MAKRKGVAKLRDEYDKVGESLGVAHALVWAFRAKPAVMVSWPTPGALDALRFASCEAHEALDAQMRLNERYVRNHRKDLSVENELADCAIMLLTAWGDEWPGGHDLGAMRQLAVLKVNASYPIEAISFCCSNALLVALGLYVGHSSPWFWVEMGLRLIACYPKMDLIERVRWRLQKIEERHVGG